MSKQYDLLLFGVTGFTGRLAAEHLLAKQYPGVKWGVCGRNPDKLKQVLSELGVTEGGIPVEICDLVCDGDAKKLDTLKSIVEKTKVVLTTAGPFEKYGQDLVKFCAELGVHYADITGETDFVRIAIDRYHDTARKTGATIVSHCGHDCIPWDLSVFVLNQEAQKKGTKLKEVRTFGELASEASGGTVQTVKYHFFEKKKEKRGEKGTDPLLTSLESASEASKYATAVRNPKADIVVEEVDRRYAGPWVMGPVMASCIRRSNALLGYSESLTYADALLRGGFGQRVADRLSNLKTVSGIVMGVYVHPWFTKAPGDGPSRETMERSHLHVYSFATLEDGSELRLKYSINEDPGYLNTAKMLVESGITLLQSTCKPAGVISPAAAMGNELLNRCKVEIGHIVEVL